MSTLFNLARMTVSSTGTGDITLNAAVSGFLTFDLAGCSTSVNGQPVSYAINDTTQSEIGTGTYHSSSVKLTGRTPNQSTNSNNAIDMSNTAQVFITPRATDIAYANENRIINGAMAIDQRNSGAAQTLTAGAAAVYTIDRWYANCTGANVNGQRVAGPTGFQYCYQFTGAALVTAIAFGQRIESFNCVDLVSSNVAVQVNMSNSLLTSVTWTAYYANATDNWAARTSIATGSWTVDGTARTYFAVFNAGANAANGIEIEFTVGAQTGGTWKITGCQVEAASASTPFQRRQYMTELALCQRYYQMGGPMDFSFPSNNSGGVITNGAIWMVYYTVYLRNSSNNPTITAQTPTDRASGNAAVDTTTLGSFGLKGDVAAGNGRAAWLNLSWTVSAEL